MAMQVLDPNCILDIERSARHLATSVDEMVENLSGLLQGVSKNINFNLEFSNKCLQSNNFFLKIVLHVFDL